MSRHGAPVIKRGARVVEALGRHGVGYLIAGSATLLDGPRRLAHDRDCLARPDQHNLEGHTSPTSPRTTTPSR
ncbi:MAG: hypothetical protein ACYC1D_11870 [Acidimicrobiales bacterium]